MSITCDPAYFESDWPPPKRCAYCDEQRQEVICREEHMAFYGESLCQGCYQDLLASPLLVENR